jgi:cytochrome c peroxidase
MPPRLFAIVACCLTLISTIALRAHTAVPTPSTEGASVQQARDCSGEPCDAVVRGARAFFDRRLRDLEANGRSCADCHMATDHFQLSPASVEARFRILRWRRGWDPDADDPLFRPIDADDFRTNGENASDFSNLRKNGLIRVVLPLPVNVRLIDPATSQPSGEIAADVWRSVPTVNDVKLTGSDGVNPWTRGPNRTGGYQMDARMATLQDQALGALINHAQIQRMPPQELLDDLAAFQRVLFTNHRVRLLADAVTDGVALPDPDPPLNALQQRGKLVFERACAHCHGGPGQSTTQAPVIRFHDVNTQCPRPVDIVTPTRFAFAPCAPRLERNARTYEITLANGTKTRRTSSDPGRALLTGFVGGPPPTDDWNKFDIPGLRGIRNTAPYFHNNSAATLEEVVDHYIEFFKRVRVNALPGVVPPVASTDGVHFDRQPALEERQALLAYLRKL